MDDDKNTQGAGMPQSDDTSTSEEETIPTTETTPEEKTV